MTRFIGAFAVIMSITSFASAQSGSSWSYHGLPNGPAIRPLAPDEITGTPWFWTKPKCAPVMLVYDPPTIALTAAPQPRKIVLGWHWYYSPSPRPTPNVTVKP